MENDDHEAGSLETDERGGGMSINTKESCPMQPGSPQRSPANQEINRSSRSSIARRRQRAKYRRRRLALLLVAVVVIAMIIGVATKETKDNGEPVAVETAQSTPTATPAVKPSEVPTTTTPTPEPPRYELTAAERDLVERIVMAEAGGEPFAGQVAVAQCILYACERDGIRPEEALEKYKYTTNRPDPKGTVPEAVTAVFDSGWYVTTEPIMYFYAPARTSSKWHESQDFVIEINGHRFFAEKGASK
jgi:N-acetylmuramoyl-L-alanine amidase